MDIIQQLEKEQAEKLLARRPIPDFRPGDTVQVNVKVVEGERSRVQAYEGVCIARNGGGIQESFTVRKISYGEGVERVFPIYSPMIELDQGRAHRQGAARQALLPARPPRQVRPHRRAQGRPQGRQGQGREVSFSGASRRDWTAKARLTPGFFVGRGGGKPGLHEPIPRRVASFSPREKVPRRGG